MEKPLNCHTRNRQPNKENKKKKHKHTHKLEILLPARPLPPLEQDELVKTADRWEEKQNADTLYSFCKFQLLFISVPLQAEIINSGEVLRLHVFFRRYGRYVLFVWFQLGRFSSAAYSFSGLTHLAFNCDKIAHFFRVPLFILVRRKGKQEEFRFPM